MNRGRHPAGEGASAQGLVKGTLFAGPTPTGGWDVRIIIPTDPIA